jgi:hypothetical protein
MLPVISSGRTRDRVPALGSLLISTSALTAVALVAVDSGRAQTAAPPAQVAENQGQLPPVNIEAPRKKPQARAKKPRGQLSTAAVARSGTVGQPGTGGDSHDAAQRRRRKRKPVGAAGHRNTGFR